MTNDKTVHVWLGVYPGNDGEWERYFDLDAYGAECGFCKDTRKEWFDFDKFSAYNRGDPAPVDEVMVEVPYSEQFEDEPPERVRRLSGSPVPAIASA
ncbi:immunity 22 family protein [Clavibacter tessellarius]|uniref:immunity 22 family protein n=1 Tax=Clavibacter tessellarius TaxID=31965 RepID=UPI00324BEF8C